MTNHIDPKQIAKAKEWAETVNHYDDTYNREELTIAGLIANLPDQIIDAEKVRDVINHHRHVMHQGLENDLEALITSLLPTLADLIEEGHAPDEYQWVQAEHRDKRCIIIRINSQAFQPTVSLLTSTGATIWVSPDEVIPLPDNPRLVWPAQEPEPDEEIPTPEVAPKALVTEEDYRNTPRDTVAKDTTSPFSDVWDKWYENEWRTTTRHGSSKGHTNAEMADTTRQVIWAPEVQA